MRSTKLLRCGRSPACTCGAWWGVAMLLLVAVATVRAEDPIRIVGAEQGRLDEKLPDGGLPPAIGVANIQVFRACRQEPDITDGKGWTYNHHVDIACWSGRLYVAWDNGQRDEDTWPAREVFSTSVDGLSWSAPAELFPMGISNPLRMYFFRAPNGHMLVIAARRIVRGKMTKDPTAGGVVVREILSDHTLGPVYGLIQSGPAEGAPPFYAEASDKSFVQACGQLLADRTYLEQQDFGALLKDRRMKPYDGAPADFGKAFCFFHRKDGMLVGIGKKGWVVSSADDGASWSGPIQLQNFHAGTAKEWIERTSDDRYAWAHDPFPAARFPLVVLSGDDGVTFGDMRVVHGEVPRQRYAGADKNIGPQYVRGLSHWNDDGSRHDDAMWLAYSVNKEDIWVSRIPVPIASEASGPVADRFGEFPAGGLVRGWNTYCPKWGGVGVIQPQAAGGNCLDLEIHDPYDYALASRVFPDTAKVKVHIELMAMRVSGRELQIELWSRFGDERPVRMILSTDGHIAAVMGHGRLALGRYPVGQWMNLDIEADAAGEKYSISSDGTKLASDLTLAEKAESFGRLVFRTGEYRALPTRGDEVPAGMDKPTDSSEYLVRAVVINPK
jgi:hypothetical protein